MHFIICSFFVSEYLSVLFFNISDTNEIQRFNKWGFMNTAESFLPWDFKLHSKDTVFHVLKFCSSGGEKWWNRRERKWLVVREMWRHGMKETGASISFLSALAQGLHPVLHATELCLVWYCRKKKKLGINFRLCFCMRPISPVLFSIFYSLQHQTCQPVLTLIVLLSSLVNGSSSGWNIR